MTLAACAYRPGGVAGGFDFDTEAALLVTPAGGNLLVPQTRHIFIFPFLWVVPHRLQNHFQLSSGGAAEAAEAEERVIMQRAVTTGKIMRMCNEWTQIRESTHKRSFCRRDQGGCNPDMLYQH